MNIRTVSLAIAILLSLTLAAAAQQPNQSQTENSGFTSNLITAASAAVPAFIGAMLPLYVHLRRKKDTERKIFRDYAVSLADASRSLLRTMSEIFVNNRYYFLNSASLPQIYHLYKRQYALYRIARVLGWIRAIHLKLDTLPRKEKTVVSDLLKNIGCVSNALSDGRYAELHHLRHVCDVWKINPFLPPIDTEGEKRLAITFEKKLQDTAGIFLEQDLVPDEHEKHRICRTLADYLCTELKISPIADDNLKPDIALPPLLTTEALLYSGWQNIIGDKMLDPNWKHDDRFKLIGFDAFIKLLDEETVWMNTFKKLITDVDINDKNDLRVDRLKQLALAVIDLLNTLVSKEKDLIKKNEQTEIEKLKKELKDHPPRYYPV